MNEDAWFNNVEEILGEMGMDLDHQNDGWEFMFQNGWSPIEAVSEMMSGG